MKNALCERRVSAVNCKGIHIVNGEKIVCGKEGTNQDFYKVETKNHGVIYMCPDCYHKVESYYTENGLKANQEKKHGFTYSFEFEMTNSEAPYTRTLQYNGFLPTHDSTVSIEYKSPIYQSLNGLRKLFRSLNNELDNSYFEDEAGTHCNIGHVDYINSDTIELIGAFYHELFQEMSDWLKANPYACKEIFGRPLNRWASPIDNYTSPRSHSNLINIEHSTHLEFRMCKFINENQYIDCVQLNTKIVKAIIKNFLQKVDEPFNEKKFKDRYDFLTYKARYTSNKIVQLLEKECKAKNIPFYEI